MWGIWRGGTWEGEGRQNGRWEWDVWDSGYKSQDERDPNLCVEEQTARCIFSVSSHTTKPGCHNADSHTHNIVAIIMMINWLLLLSTAFQTVWVILNVHLPWLPLVEVDKGPWLPYIPVSFLPQVGTGAAQEVYSFYEIIPQLEKHTLSKKKWVSEVIRHSHWPPIRELGLFWRWKAASLADSAG